ncbi:hypothetical protein [Candidatus Nitrotoga arctica]|uniref:hypothetical protein n=1 Tax=Candidatus Nitrotoga arctica TaxID=453162 RepID=UPI001EFBC443|nr:hypothetical protein [Candidatus Nitrotoga arctica]
MNKESVMNRVFNSFVGHIVKVLENLNFEHEHCINVSRFGEALFSFSRLLSRSGRKTSQLIQAWSFTCVSLIGVNLVVRVSHIKKNGICGCEHGRLGREIMDNCLKILAVTGASGCSWWLVFRGTLKYLTAYTYILTIGRYLAGGF